MLLPSFVTAVPLEGLRARREAALAKEDLQALESGNGIAKTEGFSSVSLEEVLRQQHALVTAQYESKRQGALHAGDLHGLR